MESIMERLASYIKWPKENNQSPVELANCGFWCTGGDVVECCSCKCRFSGSKILEDHARSSPLCQMGIPMATPKENPPTTEKPKDNKPADRPINPPNWSSIKDYSSYTKRVESFSKCTVGMAQTPAQFADAGFYYVGPSDRVKCFVCHLGLHNWDPHDVPMDEHKRWRSNCQYLKDYVISDPFDVEPREIRARLDTPTVRKVMEMGYDKEAVSAVIESKLLKSGDDFESMSKIIEELQAYNGDIPSYMKEIDALKQRAKCFTHERQNAAEAKARREAAIKAEEERQKREAAIKAEERQKREERQNNQDPDDELRSLKEEHTRLMEQRQCKVCMNKDMNIVFLPCGHLTCCDACAPSLRNCPICRTNIRGTIKTYLS